tara:strand:+ start:66 stop:737 length:672 start_codon:yes stop_codon:yes gene_type:complete
MIIAEIGINHLGNINTLKKYILFLNKLKIEGITIQILSKSFFKGKIKKFYIKRDILFKTIVRYSKKKIGIVTDKYDKLLIKNLKHIDFIKVLGSQIHNQNILKRLQIVKKPIFFSNRGLNKKKEKELIDLVKKKDNFYIVHTQLKTQKKFTNLKNLNFLKKELKNKVCFGSHCDDSRVIIHSLKYKPKKIFFYIKDDKDMNYPDYSYAIPLSDLRKLIKEINK